MNRMELILPLDPDSESYNLKLHGQCYMSALAVARDLHNHRLDNPTNYEHIRICHGVVSIQSAAGGRPIGERIMHAWTELQIPVPEMDTEMHLAVDASNPGYPVVVLTSEAYYHLGKVKPDCIRRYTLDEVAGYCEQLGHFGPFHKPLDFAADWTAIDEARLNDSGIYADDREYTEEQNATFEALVSRILGA